MTKAIKNIAVWIKRYSSRIFNSIAFYPAFISFVCLIFATLLLYFDLSEYGNTLKQKISWLTISNSDTARTILAAIAGGMISLTVFSFSMVMIVLTRAASQMSNRVLDNLIGNRFQQITLGIYIGTIIYSFFLLGMIREGENSLQLPGISILALMLLTVFNIFLFIYFLHFVTQSVKFDTIIRRIFRATESVLEKRCTNSTPAQKVELPRERVEIKALKSGVYEGVDLDNFEKQAAQHEFNIYFIYPKGTFVLKNQVVGYYDRLFDLTAMRELNEAIYISSRESIERNYHFGLKQLTEIAIKALSPGINDPGTAIISLQSLTILLSYRLDHFPANCIQISTNSYLYRTTKDFSIIFEQSIFPMLDYGKNDRLFLEALVTATTQLKQKANLTIFDKVINRSQEYLENL